MNNKNDMINRKSTVVLMLSVILIVPSCSKSQVKDMDGNTYKTIKIGNQIWTASNLTVSLFRNGDSIPKVEDAKEWNKAGLEGKPAWCYYDNDPENGKKYGKLYNWFAINDPRGLAPEGWHVPSKNEWTELTDYLGGKNEAGNKMQSTNGWNENENGTNESGFSGSPGGGRYEVGYFGDVERFGYWWSSTAYNNRCAWSGFLGYSKNTFYMASNDGKHYGFSVRCIMD